MDSDIGAGGLDYDSSPTYTPLTYCRIQIRYGRVVWLWMLIWIYKWWAGVVFCRYLRAGVLAKRIACGLGTGLGEVGHLDVCEAWLYVGFWIRQYGIMVVKLC